MAERPILFLDAVGGVSGDMLVAALIDLGLELAFFEAEVAALGLQGVALRAWRESRHAMQVTRFEVKAESGPSRDFADIRELIERSPLDAAVKDASLATFRRLAEAEAEVHGVDVDHVHFHEVGAVDSIVDIVAVCAGVAHLGAQVVSSPLPLGRGLVRTEHGVLPLPAPATLGCLRGVPTVDGGVDAELVTPTGAALVVTLASDYQRWPAMRPERIGVGAGSRQRADRPNVLRLILGHPLTTAAQTLALLECNLDDCSAEWIAYASSRLFDEGALDVWTTSIGMKKSRPGTTLSVLAPPERVQAMERVLFAETSTLGVRRMELARVARPRHIVRVETVYGPIPVKVAEGDGHPPHAAPEHDACAAAARAYSVPLREVMAAALAAYRSAHE